MVFFPPFVCGRTHLSTRRKTCLTEGCWFCSEIWYLFIPFIKVPQHFIPTVGDYNASEDDLVMDC